MFRLNDPYSEKKKKKKKKKNSPHLATWVEIHFLPLLCLSLVANATPTYSVSRERSKREMVRCI